MKFRIALLACTTLTLTFAATLAAQSPNPNEPYVQSITYGGTGCPQGSVASSFANDRKSFTLIFDSFVASSGPGIPVTDARKNCQININVREPLGSGQYCAVTAYRGYVQAPAGVTAEQKAIYYGPGDQEIVIGDEDSEEDPARSRATLFVGPVARDYLTTDHQTWSFDNEAARVTPLNINSQVRLIGSSSASAQITTDSIDGKIVPGPCVEDTTGPAITISSPVLFGTYGLGAVVTPQFTCTDAGSGVASCTGAALLDTTSIGPKTFTVTAVDNAGNTSTSTVSYAVGGKNECKAGGHNKFLAPTFKNQGQCVSSFVQ
jgi:hypothetical protein